MGNSAGFTRAEYERFCDPGTTHVGYGEVEWSTDGSKAVGRFEIVSDMVSVEMLIRLNRMRLDEPTILVKLNNHHLARIDVNGRHAFPDGVRRSTHLQAHANGSESKEVTTELTSYPPLDMAGYPDFDTQLMKCFQMSEPHLRVEVSGVIWTPNPFEGGA